MALFNDLRLIGSGGFGEVYLCERESDGEKFAKKHLSFTSPDVIARFAREIRLLDSLDHPNIVKVVAKQLNQSPYYYVMPLYRLSLDQHINQLIGDLSRVEAIFSRILDGMAYAHEQGVIHRDLKPQNVLLNSDVDIVVSDFGLGRQLDSLSARQTSTGMHMGTPLYMAPEQFTDSKTADQRCDVYALGRMLIELYTGTLTMGVPNLNVVPPRILPIIHRSTHQDPNKRFDSSVEFRNAWQQALSYSSNSSGSYAMQQLIAEFSATPDLAYDKVSELVNALIDCVSDPDELLSAIMKLPHPVIGRAFMEDQNSMTSVFEAFGSFIAEKGFSFEYTDSVATHCTNIFHEISSSLSRAKIIASVAQLGVNHNRWFVIKRAANLIESIKSNEDIQETINLLSTLNNETRDRIANYIDFSKIGTRLRQLLEVPPRNT